MRTVLGVNAVFHDPAAALVVDGEVVAAAEEERFSRRKHGKPAVAFAAWELPIAAIEFCLRHAGLGARDIDAVGYSYDPTLAAATEPSDPEALIAGGWEGLRTLYAERVERFLHAALPELACGVQHVAHHIAHAASAWGAAPFETCAVMVLDGRGERASYLAGRADKRAAGAMFTPLAEQRLPHSLGLRYEELTAHLGFRRSSDEYKVMALAAYGEPTHLDDFRRLIRTNGHGGFVTSPVDWASFAPAGTGDAADGRSVNREQADLACSVQTRLEEVLIELAEWLAGATGERRLAMAGGVALNCVANSRLFEEGPFEDVWVQPAAGDAGTALGAAIQIASERGDVPRPMRTAALGPEWNDSELEAVLRAAKVPYERSPDVAAEVAAELAADGIVAWYQGRSEFGPRALGHRSLLAHPGRAANLERLNDVKGREQFRPVAPMVTIEQAKDIFEGGPIPSPLMLFTHRVRPEWRDRIPAAVHVDGTARIQTVDATDEPLVHRMLTEFRRHTGVPVVINTSLNTAGRPMVDHPRDALECFGSAPIDLLALGPFVVRRQRMFAAGATA